MAASWHPGERAMQARAGMAEKMAKVAAHVVRSAMPDQHRTFFAQLPFILAGHRGRAGKVWASLLQGPPGFVASPDPRTLSIAARPLPGDPLARALEPGLAMGLLGIELPTRRRNRANGHVLAAGPDGFAIAVAESFGNCPKYIERRGYLADRPPGAPMAVEPLPALDGAARRLIANATMFFVASCAGGDSLPDISHRGGPPGFVRVGADGVLTVPDYAGNFFFNTLGNFLLYPRAGLLFADFEAGDLLQLTGDARLVESGDAPPLPGAERLWRFTTTEGRWLRGALRLRLTAGEASPFWP